MYLLLCFLLCTSAQVFPGESSPTSHRYCFFQREVLYDLTSNYSNF